VTAAGNAFTRIIRRGIHAIVTLLDISIVANADWTIGTNFTVPMTATVNFSTWIHELVSTDIAHAVVRSNVTVGGNISVSGDVSIATDIVIIAYIVVGSNASIATDITVGRACRIKGLIESSIATDITVGTDTVIFGNVITSTTGNEKQRH